MEKKDTLKNNDAMIDPQKVREQSIDGIKLNSGDLKPNDFEGVDVSGFKSEATKDENNIPSDRNDAMIDSQKVREQSIDGIKLNSIDLKPNDFEGVDVSGFKSEAVDVMLDEIDNSEIKENTNNTPRHR